MSTKLDANQAIQLATDESNEALRVNMVAGSAIVNIDFSQVDDAPFTPATDKVAMIGAFANNTLPDSVNEGDAGAVRMSTNRNLFTSIRDGSGNERGANVTAANELNVLATAQPGVDIGDVTINNPSIAVTGPLTDAELRATPVPVSATDLDIRDLVFATDKVDVSGSDITVSGTTIVSATDLDIRDLSFATDSVDVSGSNITISGSALPSGASTEAKQDAGNASLVQIDANTDRLDTVDFLDTPLLVASSVNIPGSGSSPVTVVASLAASVKKIQILDTTGFYFGVYSDPAGTPVLEAIVGPGSDQTVELILPASTVIGLRSMTAAAIVNGNVAINFIG